MDISMSSLLQGTRWKEEWPDLGSRRWSDKYPFFTHPGISSLTHGPGNKILLKLLGIQVNNMSFLILELKVSFSNTI